MLYVGRLRNGTRPHEAELGFGQPQPADGLFGLKEAVARRPCDLATSKATHTSGPKFGEARAGHALTKRVNDPRLPPRFHTPHTAALVVSTFVHDRK